MNNQTRINKLFSFYEQVELNLEQARDELTPIEALYIERVIEYRREQLHLLAEIERLGDSPASELKKIIAKGLGAAAACYERQLMKGRECNS